MEAKSTNKEPGSEHSGLPIPSGPWIRFWRLVSEPWTAILLVASVLLFAIGQKKLDQSVMALVQILLAVSSGVLGARVTNLLEAASGQSVLEARGKVAVRGLKLMLVQTAAFQRRIESFRANRTHMEAHPEVTQRNYEEAVEFCRRIQEDAASAMETWGDVVPSADLSSLIGRITAAEDEHEATKIELIAAKELLDSNKESADNAEKLKRIISSLESRLQVSDNQLERLNKRLARRTSLDNTRGVASDIHLDSFVSARDAVVRARAMMARDPNVLPVNALVDALRGPSQSVDSDDKK
ncbi:hypothetical protein [Xanthomonas sp. MWU16-30325]|uniref:hypothetical protein n=1 Tax=Xanthomonas sp. MWU16-30325 TaxID=2878096 RepID=UPI001CF8F145|nr:hypothetical protein [Xanthomonas sp. MWU16-30325]